MDLADKGFLKLRLAGIETVAEGVKSFFLEHAQGLDLPAFSPGSHLVLLLDTGGRIRRNAYSLTSDPDDRRRYGISVLHQPDGRGGSRFLHESLRVGDELTVRRPLNFFPVDRLARRHLLIAGGIGNSIAWARPSNCIIRSARLGMRPSSRRFAPAMARRCMSTIAPLKHASIFPVCWLSSRPAPMSMSAGHRG